MTTYAKNNGQYQTRADYYQQILSRDESATQNQYLKIYHCAVNLYSTFHQRGLGYFDRSSELSQSWESGITAIRDTEGLARSWGHAKEVLDLIARWRGFVMFLPNPRDTVNTEATSTELLSEALESLLDSLLETLPSYVSWTPTAKLPENQAVLEFLQNRSNTYRTVANPKFYAYDRVVGTIANATIPVTAQNCQYFKGVGPRIKQHIVDFFNGTASTDLTAPEAENEDDVDLSDADEHASGFLAPRLFSMELVNFFANAELGPKVTVQKVLGTHIVPHPALFRVTPTQIPLNSALAFTQHGNQIYGIASAGSLSPLFALHAHYANMSLPNPIRLSASQQMRHYDSSIRILQTIASTEAGDRLIAIVEKVMYARDRLYSNISNSTNTDPTAGVIYDSTGVSIGELFNPNYFSYPQFCRLIVNAKVRDIPLTEMAPLEADRAEIRLATDYKQELRAQSRAK